ncbi:hypothetical protein [Acidocella sp.]|uniref:hypothetical protein n=1 Tax=Acidocella sp. TaxID=50710 RepID=UPI002610499F|nr:hypothetical protein [Acidocella sp.]
MPARARGGLFGEAHLDLEGVLHGWCWNPSLPRARLTVELIVEGQSSRTVVASRFREDLRERGIGDGYHAFNLPLPPAVLVDGKYAALRAAGTKTIFWQINALKLKANPLLASGIATLRQHVAEAADAVGDLGRTRKAAATALALRAMAKHLREMADARA